MRSVFSLANSKNLIFGQALHFRVIKMVRHFLKFCAINQTQEYQLTEMISSGF